MPLAVRQLGLVTRNQARALGLSEAQIRTLLESRTWNRTFQGIYAVTGFPRTWQQQTLAACLFADGFASHQTAAHLYGLISRPEMIDITCSSSRKNSESVTFHRTNDLSAADTARVSGIPCLTPSRMLCTLGATVDEETLEVVLEQALHRRLTTPDRLQRRLGELGTRGRPGIRSIRSLLAARGTEPAAESFLEVRAIRLLRKARVHPARQ